MSTDWQSSSSIPRRDNPLYGRGRRAAATPESSAEDEETAQDVEAQKDATASGARPQPVDEGLDPVDVWQKTLHELALQLPETTFETWVRDTSLIDYRDGEFIIGAPHAYARDWLQNRLREKISRILNQLTRRSVQVNFEVRPQTRRRSEPSEPAPLYAEVPTDAPETTASRTDTRASAADAVAGRPATSSRSRAPAQRDPARTAATRMNTVLHGGAFNPRYTFENFVVGNHNRLAHAAAQSIVEQPGHRFNPLFVYGGVGLGKTHLLHAIGHAMKMPGKQVLYCSSEQFTNDLISAIRQQSTEEFRNKYRQVDLLLIDDIQFIGGKESTQEEFFHTFNHLHAGGRQVVISSDRPPKEIATLEARLRSRFEGGLQADISQPDLETRVAILQSKAQSINHTVSIEVLMLIAERVESNIRELEGALNRLIVQAPLHDSQLNRSVAEGILESLVPQRRPREAASVVQIVAKHFGLGESDLLGRSRTKEIANARQLAMYLLREENGLSLIHIGSILGGRDHSTVRHGVEKVSQDIERDEAVRRQLVVLREKIYEPPGS
ncbi:MAG: chromosomal replication initiator protein DnaA [Caldilineaceae bacterium]|nr:chromosomal replication initiator protein DnaA [Caldilineaceae bacterium]MCY4118110.1 chromosomal replication initiator protein DnaA [Caldilineaceae bacterium]MDE0431692.1 chromosomal replication initiator protein DnaA [Caldilineaceae bacterium]